MTSTRMPDADVVLPSSIAAPMAWIAFDDVFAHTDWRLRLASLNPFKLVVEHDEDFGAAVSGSSSWRARDQARAWIANRIVQLAAAINKTDVRRYSLQPPETPEDTTAEALLSNLERRIRDTVLDELVDHFDQSIPEWERDIQVEVATLDDADTRWQVSRFVGLDQGVSVDAMRKAIRFVFSRTHWYLSEVNGVTQVVPDWRFEQVRALRASLDERTRARSLVARCIETLVEEHAREQRAGVEVAPMTRLRLKAEIERIFHEKGVWGVIETVLPRDRSRHYLRCPDGLGEHLEGLVQQQEQRMVIG